MADWFASKPALPGGPLAIWCHKQLARSSGFDCTSHGPRAVSVCTACAMLGAELLGLRQRFRRALHRTRQRKSGNQLHPRAHARIQTHMKPEPCDRKPFGLLSCRAGPGSIHARRAIMCFRHISCTAGILGGRSVHTGLQAQLLLDRGHADELLEGVAFADDEGRGLADAVGLGRGDVFVRADERMYENNRKYYETNGDRRTSR